ncbi:MAG: ribbon-helix-helix protein, CopG family [Chloroflexota bacterium]
MNGRTVTVTLPEALYERVQETARATSRSLEEVMA